MEHVKRIGRTVASIEEESAQTDLAEALERLEAITKPVPSGLFYALEKFDKEKSWLRD